MGAIFNQPASLARLVGVYKAIQSAGAAGAFAMDSAETAYMSELAATWAVCVAGLVFCVPVLLFRLKDRASNLRVARLSLLALTVRSLSRYGRRDRRRGSLSRCGFLHDREEG
jgi:hypothetical protein